MRNEFDHPRHLNIELTGWCNQKCLYCFNDSVSTNRLSDGSINDWMAVLPMLRQQGLESVHLTGGEPFALKGIVRLLAHCDELGIRVSVLSNGFRVAKLAEEDPDALRVIHNAQISLDTLDELKLIARRGSKRAMADAMSAIDALLALNVSVDVSAVIDSNVLVGLSELVAFCDRRNLGLIIRRIESQGRNIHTSIDTTDQVQKELETILRGKQDLLKEDRYSYLPSCRERGVNKGIWTVEFSGAIRPRPFTLGTKLIESRERLLALAACGRLAY